MSIDLTDREAVNAIVFLEGDIPSTYFPAGRPQDGGTCAYATAECIEECPSGQLTNPHEIAALGLMKSQTARWLVGTILAELGGRTLFQWHVWGDCLPELTAKCALVMRGLERMGVRNFGFTRNPELWKLASAAGIHVGLSVDTEKEAVELSQTGHVCWPDRYRGVTRMYANGQMTAICNGWWCTWLPEEEMHNSDCRRCITERRGCFHALHKAGVAALPEGEADGEAK